MAAARRQLQTEKIDGAKSIYEMGTAHVIRWAVSIILKRSYLDK